MLDSSTLTDLGSGSFLIENSFLQRRFSVAHRTRPSLGFVEATVAAVIRGTVVHKQMSAEALRVLNNDCGFGFMYGRTVQNRSLLIQIPKGQRKSNHENKSLKRLIWECRCDF